MPSLKSVFCIGKTLKDWPSVLDEVVGVINSNKPSTKNDLALLTEFFTKTAGVLIPQAPDFFKFKIGDRVVAEYTKKQRRDLSYKFTLQLGMLACEVLVNKSGC